MAGASLLGKVLNPISVVKRGATVPVIKASLYAGEIINAERYAPSGDDSAPLPDDMGFFVRIEGTDTLVYVGAIDQVNAPVSAAGEKRLYSRDSAGVIKATVYLTAAGIAEINGAADFAVRYNALQTAFDELKAAFNSHTHPVGPAVPQSAADITAAKVNEVKLP